jgi:CysZ protein
MIGPFVTGFRYGTAGLGWLLKPRIRSYVILPILVNAAVFAAGFVWLAGRVGELQARVMAWLPDWLDWLAWLLWPIAILAALVLIWTGFTVIANLIGSPFNGLLSERVAALHDPAGAPAGSGSWTDLLRAPVDELRKLLYFVALALVPLILSFIPVVNVISPLAWGLYGAWILAVEYADYPMANAGLRPRVQRSVLRGQRRLALGFGAGVLLLTIVPGLNLVAMPSAVIGATLLWSDRLREDPVKSVAAGRRTLP